MLQNYPTNDELKNHEFLPASALNKFYDSSAQYRPQSLEHMHSLIGHPLTSDEMSVCIKDYNDQMNPHITIFGCSVCGIRDLSGDQHNLNLSQLSSLIVPDIKFQQYMTCTPEIKSCFNIVVVNISGKQTGFY